MPEVVNSFDTAQGKFDVVKYVNGPEHIYSVESGHMSHDKVINAHHDPELQKKWDEEREEQARRAGDVALDATHDEAEQPLGPAAEGAAAARKISEAMNGQADEVVARLDKILPEVEKREKTLEEKFDALQKNSDRQFKLMTNALELIAAGKYEEAAGLLRGEKLNKKPSSAAEPEKNLNQSGEEEYRTQDMSGHPVIIRHRLSDNSWRISKNGDNPSDWFEYNEDIIRSYGIEPGVTQPDSVVSGESVDSEKEDTVDADAMEASMARLAAIQKEMSENPSQERMQELINEFAQENAKLSGTWEKGTETTEEVAITKVMAIENGGKRKRSIFQRASDFFRRKKPAEEAAAAAVAAGAVVEGEPGAPQKIEVTDASASEAEAKEKKERRRYSRRVLGALAVGGGLVAAYYLGRNGHPTTEFNTMINNFCQGHGISGFGPDHLPIHHSHVDLSGINPNTIHAQSPEQFQHGVLHILQQQGIHAHGVTSEKLAHMNHYMETQGIASGMKQGAHGLEQNLTSFPGGGHEFANAQNSAEQGFGLGHSGTGREALDAWVREAERSGITFTRG